MFFRAMLHLRLMVTVSAQMSACSSTAMVITGVIDLYDFTTEHGASHSHESVFCFAYRFEHADMLSSFHVQT